MPVKYKAPGKGFLQVPGILMIVFSSILILILLLGATVLGSVGAMAGLADVDMAEAMEELMDGAQVMLDDPTVHRELLALGLGMIMIVLNLISGIVGTALCNKPGGPAVVCLLFGLILLAGGVLSLALSGFAWSGLLGLVLPILYTIGACLNLFARRPARDGAPVQ